MGEDFGKNNKCALSVEAPAYTPCFLHRISNESLSMSSCLLERLYSTRANVQKEVLRNEIWRAFSIERVLNFMPPKPYFCRDILKIRVANYVVQNSTWEDDSRSAGQILTVLLQILNVHCHIHKNSPLVPNLSQKDPVHTGLGFFEIHFNIISSFILTL